MVELEWCPYKWTVHGGIRMVPLQVDVDGEVRMVPLQVDRTW